MKKLIPLILTLTILTASLSGIQLTLAASTLNPYVGFDTTSFDSTSATHGRITKVGGKLGALGRGQTVTFEDIDFGENPAVSVMLQAAGSSGTSDVVYLHLDSTSNEPFATLEYTGNGWGVIVEDKVNITATVAGVHDLILKTGTKTDLDYFRIQFTQLETGDSVYTEYNPERAAYGDIAESEYRREINFMHDMGFDLKTIEDKLYYPNLPVTRGRFAQVLYNLLDGSKASGDVSFDDVEAASEFHDAVSYAASMGYIKGYGDGSFKPTRFIEMNEAVIILSRVLGYDTYADAAGGTYAHYYQVASAYDLLEGIEVSGVLTEELMARLIYNAVMADYFEPVGFGEDSRTYERKSGGILSKISGIEKGEGLIAANSFSALSSPKSPYNDNRVYIGGEHYYAGESLARSLLGYECEFLYYDDGSTKTILWIEPLYGTETVTLSSKDTDIGDVTADKVVYYDEKGKEKKIEIDDNAYVLYNGVAADDRLSNLMNSKEFRGYITYVDNAGENDTLMINEYVDIAVDGINASEKTLYDDVSGKNIVLSGDEAMSFFTVNGLSGTLNDVSVGNIGILYKSKNKSGKTINRFVIGGASVTGTVEAMKDGEPVINGVTYKLGQSFTETIKIGDTAVFGLNDYNEIVKVSDTADIIMVGYLIKAGTEVTGLNRKSLVELKTTANVIETYQLNETCTVNGVKTKNNEANLTGVTVNAPVCYKLNADGLITMLDTLNAADEPASENNRLRVAAEKLTGGFYWFASSRTFCDVGSGYNSFILNPDAKILFKTGDYSPEDDFVWKSTSNLITNPMLGTGYTYGEEDYYADIFLWTQPDVTYSDSIVFEKITQEINADGDTVSVLNGFNGSKTVKCADSGNNPAVEQIMKKLEEGDYVRARLNGAGEIDELEIIALLGNRDKITYTSNAGASVEVLPKLTGTTSVSSSRVSEAGAFAYGTITDRDGQYVEVTHNNGTVEYIYVGSAMGVRKDEYGLTNGVPASGIEADDVVYFSFVSRNVTGVYIVKP